MLHIIMLLKCIKLLRYLEVLMKNEIILGKIVPFYVLFISVFRQQHAKMSFLLLPTVSAKVGNFVVALKVIVI